MFSVFYVSSWRPIFFYFSSSRPLFFLFLLIETFLSFSCLLIGATLYGRDAFIRACITATHCNTLQHTATHCNTLQHTAAHCYTLQHTATRSAFTHCDTLQRPATHFVRVKPESGRDVFIHKCISATCCKKLQRIATHTLHVSRMDESCCTDEWVMSHTHESVMSLIRMSHAAHPTYKWVKWVMLPWWMRHVTHTWISHAIDTNEPCCTCPA